MLPLSLAMTHITAFGHNFGIHGVMQQLALHGNMYHT